MATNTFTLFIPKGYASPFRGNSGMLAIYNDGEYTDQWIEIKKISCLPIFGEWWMDWTNSQALTDVLSIYRCSGSFEDSIDCVWDGFYTTSSMLYTGSLFARVDTNDPPIDPNFIAKLYPVPSYVFTNTKMLRGRGGFSPYSSNVYNMGPSAGAGHSNYRSGYTPSLYFGGYATGSVSASYNEMLLRPGEGICIYQDVIANPGGAPWSIALTLRESGSTSSYVWIDQYEGLISPLPTRRIVSMSYNSLGASSDVPMIGFLNGSGSSKSYYIENLEIWNTLSEQYSPAFGIHYISGWYNPFHNPIPYLSASAHDTAVTQSSWVKCIGGGFTPVYLGSSRNLQGMAALPAWGGGGSIPRADGYLFDVYDTKLPYSMNSSGSPGATAPDSTQKAKGWDKEIDSWDVYNAGSSEGIILEPGTGLSVSFGSWYNGSTQPPSMNMSSAWQVTFNVHDHEEGQGVFIAPSRPPSVHVDGRVQVRFR